MDLQQLTRGLHQPADTRIVLVVADGLGGLPRAGGGQTELESARTPHLDELARQGTTGLIHPVLPGITCGSGPGHLALFGYDPLQYRFAVVLRGEGLGDQVSDTDPRATGVEPGEPRAADERAQKTVRLLQQFTARARDLLADQQPANMILLRGLSAPPEIPSLRDVYGLDACAFAIYPMYRGLARLLAMHVPEAVDDLPAQVQQLESHWENHTFFFLHYKDTDSSGEDGNFDRKVDCIEALDALLPRIAACQPDVLIVTGDHSTPSRLRNHSWHPVPVLLSAATCRPDVTTCFGEREASRGGLGQLEAKYLMPLALAHAGRLDKYGA
jgi:2,3-bisphosphoglycerate-independent phosphoglycerate mutase